MEGRRELCDKFRAKIGKKAEGELWASWQTFFPLLTHFVTDLYHRMEIFKDMVEVVSAKPETLSPPVLFNWMRDNYIVSECMAIRRMLDVDERSISLGRLLREIELRPELLSKTRYFELVRDKGLSESAATESFDRMLGQSVDHITTELVAADIARLEDAETNIRKLVNKRFAHSSPFTQVPEFEVFHEIEQAIEELDQIVVKYDSLIYGGFLSTTHAAKLNWKQPLAVAWLPRDTQSSVPSYGGPTHRAL